MALDITFKGASANSYGSLAEADSHFQTKPYFYPTWVGLNSGIAIASFVGGTTTVFTMSSSSHGILLGDTLTVSGTGEVLVDVAGHTVTAVSGAVVTTDVDSTGASTATGTAVRSEAQNNLLIEATRAIDTYEFSGTQIDTTTPQALQFPRYINGEAQTIIPARVKLAQFEAAIFLKLNQDASGQIDTREIIQVAVNSGLANVRYASKSGAGNIEMIVGANIMAIEQYLREYLDTLSSFNWKTA